MSDSPHQQVLLFTHQVTAPPLLSLHTEGSTLFRAALPGKPNGNRGSSSESGIRVSEFQSWLFTTQLCEFTENISSLAV